jgi:hypothetical protein
MANYSFASEIKLVPTFYLSTSSFEYYDWEDATDPPLKPEKKIVVACGTKWLDTKKDVCSSWIDSVIGEECLKKLRAQDAKILHPKKKVVFA